MLSAASLTIPPPAPLFIEELGGGGDDDEGGGMSASRAMAACISSVEGAEKEKRTTSLFGVLAWLFAMSPPSSTGLSHALSMTPTMSGGSKRKVERTREQQEESCHDALLLSD